MIGGGDSVADNARGFTEGRSIILAGFLLCKNQTCPFKKKWKECRHACDFRVDEHRRRHILIRFLVHFNIRIISKRVGVILRIQGAKDSRVRVKYFIISIS